MSDSISITNMKYAYYDVNNSKYQRYIFHNFSCEFSKNKINVILGKSGCGKSTLLKILSNITACKGKDKKTLIKSIKVDNEDLLQAIKRKKISFLPQDFNLAYWLTAEQNICLSLKFYDIKEPMPLAQKMLKYTHCGDLITKHPYQLSGGQRRRTAIGMALCTSAEYVLLDEPFSNLDYITKNEFYEFILNNWRINFSTEKYEEMNRGLLVVTHDIEEAIILGDKIFVFDESPVSSYELFDNTIAQEKRKTMLESIREESEFVNIKKKLIDALKNK